MRLRTLTTFTVAAAAMLAIAACSNESPTAPRSAAVPTDTASHLLGGLLGQSNTTTKIIPLLRSTPLAQDVVVSKTIGVLGGTITIPEAGLTLVVPPLAVGKNTNFRITARKGSYVAYEMEPHGTKFLLPLVATQSLVKTNASGLLKLNLSLGYYEDASRITTVSELLGVQVDLLKLTAISTIPHFSGYIYASGREEANEEY